MERLKGRRRPLKTPGRKWDDEQNGEDKRVQNMLLPSKITMIQTNGSESRVPTECPKIVAGSIPTDRDRKYKEIPARLGIAEVATHLGHVQLKGCTNRPGGGTETESRGSL